MNSRGTTILFWIVSILLFTTPLIFLAFQKPSNDIQIKELPQTITHPKYGIKVHLEGAVEKSGIYTVEVGTKVFEFLNQVKISPTASTRHLNLAKTLRDGQKIIIKEQERVKAININLASKKQLQSIPGIGAATANKIISHRMSKGAFKSINDLLNIKGISKRKLKKIQQYIII